MRIQVCRCSVRSQGTREPPVFILLFLLCLFLFFGNSTSFHLQGTVDGQEYSRALPEDQIIARGQGEELTVTHCSRSFPLGAPGCWELRASGTAGAGQAQAPTPGSGAENQQSCQISPFHVCRGLPGAPKDQHLGGQLSSETAEHVSLSNKRDFYRLFLTFSHRTGSPNFLLLPPALPFPYY